MHTEIESLAMICRPFKLKFLCKRFVFKFCGIYGQTDPKTTIVAEPAALMVVKPPARSFGGLSLARRPLLLQSYNFGPNNYQNSKLFYG